MQIKSSVFVVLSTAVVATTALSGDQCYHLAQPDAPIRALQTSFQDMDFDNLDSKMEYVIKNMLDYTSDGSLSSFDQCLASYNDYAVRKIVALFQPGAECGDLSPLGMVGNCLPRFTPLLSKVVLEHKNECCQPIYENIVGGGQKENSKKMTFKDTQDADTNVELSGDRCSILTQPDAPIRSLQMSFPDMNFDVLVTEMEYVIEKVLEYTDDVSLSSFDQCLASYNDNAVQKIVALFQPDAECGDLSPLGMENCLPRFTTLLTDVVIQHEHGCCQPVYQDMMEEEDFEDDE